ncbi:P-loop containing nucleoside triphosphate hydrolase protein [Boletus coccyginus]|nr:P-loop containing nucleoside triphosphate hydrolase protein [Boletus coccyginus]
MLDQTDSSRTTIIQGPPGTGKTTVIASYVLTAVLTGRSGIWLIAQSNVAVKNIAEKLADFGLSHWKLLVSNEFYTFWHEHLYTSIKANIITSGEFLERLSELNGCPVVLCTLSMLSNDLLRKQGAFRKVPLHTVIVDEASQIEIGDYIPLFSNFTTIRKVIFIEPLLKSNELHPLADASDKSLLCYFVDVPGQQVSQGTSWKNFEECKAIVQLATIFQVQEKNYRIITPYDAQRSLIEEELKKADLEWGDKCFNVDSFQGNEEDYIIISLVRSRELGFLQDKRRVNVMLSRCKRGMVIFTNKAYIENWYEGEAWIEVGNLDKTPIV